MGLLDTAFNMLAGNAIPLGYYEESVNLQIVTLEKAIRDTKEKEDPTEEQQQKAKEEAIQKAKEEEKNIKEEIENGSTQTIDMMTSEGWSIADNGATMNDVISDPNSYKPGETTGTDNLKTMGQKILGVINAIGVVVAVCTMIIIGMRYMFAGIEEKAELKTTMIPYLIGAGLLFAVTTIVNIIYQFSTSLQNI